MNIRFYSLTFVGGIIAAYLVSRWRALKTGISEKLFDDLIFWTVLFGFVAARIYYVLFYFGEYKNNLSEIYKIWHGGLAIYGGLIGGILTVYIFCRKHKLNFWQFADLIVLGIPLGQAIGRLGNFFNYEAFGAPTSLPWKMYVPLQYRPAGYENFSYFHPTFAYELIANLLIFAILLWLSSRSSFQKTAGMIAAIYLLLYSLARFFIEGIRLDSAYFGAFRGDQITAGALILLSIGLMAYFKGFRYNT